MLHYAGIAMYVIAIAVGLVAAYFTMWNALFVVFALSAIGSAMLAIAD